MPFPAASQQIETIELDVAKPAFPDVPHEHALARLLVGGCANSHGHGILQLQMSNQSPASRHCGTVLMPSLPASIGTNRNQSEARSAESQAPILFPKNTTRVPDATTNRRLLHRYG